MAAPEPLEAWWLLYGGAECELELLGWLEWDEKLVFNGGGGGGGGGPGADDEDVLYGPAELA